jgi:hypothetical protein
MSPSLKQQRSDSHANTTHSPRFVLVVVPVLANDNFQSMVRQPRSTPRGSRPRRPATVFFLGGAATTKDGVTMMEQALANMKRLEANIATAGFSLGNVMFVRAYLTPGADGSVDYAGWDKAWGEVFNNPKNPTNPPAPRWRCRC